MSVPPAWHPDPSGRHQLRYWDGVTWTDHVSTNGVAAMDPLVATAPQGIQQVAPAESLIDRIDGGLMVGTEADANKIREQISSNSAGFTGAQGAGIQAVHVPTHGDLFAQPVLVVNQKAKLIELVNEYSVFDGNGTKIAAVTEVGQSTAKKALRLLTNVDQFLTHKFEIMNASGQVVMRLTRPAKIMKSTVVVSDASDREIGRIIQENMIGKIHFALEANGQRLGSIQAENWRAWNFRIEDNNGTEIARITKTWEGFVKAAFTTADNYVVQIHQQLPQPLSALVVAAALSVDTALKQDSK
jgi:uncharacterized protein YxjI